MDFKKIDTVAIYPAIGIARVGNAPDEYFVGPTIPGQTAKDKDDFRDEQGRIKRQAAKFFVYGLDKDGNFLGELNEDHGVKIDWRVDVANKKASWYNFDIALDTPTAKGEYDESGNPTPGGPEVLSLRRNPEYECEDRKHLMIEARAQHITGRNTNPDGARYHLKGTIGHVEKEVYLGELRTDDQGRLLFLGGRGKSDSFREKPAPLTTFANNQGWHDDTSDGPVDAKVTLPGGQEFKAKGAWVLTAPPNYAVGVQAFSTGYELLEDVASRLHADVKKDCPSFYTDIYPTLKQLSNNQWVNAGVSRDFGWGSAYDFESEQVIERLLDASDENRPFRQVIFESFRNPAYKKLEPAAWPPLYGDGVTFNIKSKNPRAWFAITQLKYDYLEQWAQGNFVVEPRPHHRKWEEMTPAEQANGLTEAALEETLGGPFHPGCEFTWPMRHAIMYSGDDPFRIKRRKTPKEDFGYAISNSVIHEPNGPLDGSSPGDLTKWMAVPWQSDTSSCLSAYRTYAGEYLPTFWPARVPNDVLSEDDFVTLNDQESSVDDKFTAFGPSSRKKWLRGFIYNEDGSMKPGGSSIADRMKGVTKFTEEWYKIGIILKRELDADDQLFPKEVWVETGRSVEEEQQFMASRSLDAAPLSTDNERPDWVDMNPRKWR